MSDVDSAASPRVVPVSEALVFSAFDCEWLPPDEWLASMYAEARRREGWRLACWNAWLRLCGRPTLIPGDEMRTSASLLWQSVVSAPDAVTSKPEWSGGSD